MQITIEALLFLYLGHGAISSIINSLQLKNLFLQEWLGS